MLKVMYLRRVIGRPPPPLDPPLPCWSMLGLLIPAAGPSSVRQVVALGTDGVQLYVRSRVTHADLTGHTWRALTVPPPEPAAASRSGSVTSLPAEAQDTAGQSGSPGPPGSLSAETAAAGGDTRSAAEAAGSQRDSDSSSGEMGRQKSRTSAGNVT